jgi:hypothetical protein
MRLLLIAAIVGLPIVWLAALWLLLRPNIAAPTMTVTLGDLLNVALFVLTIVSTFIAIASYRHAVESGQQQLDAGEKQSKTLDAQAAALEASRRALEVVVQTSERSRIALEGQLEIAKQQRADEQARLARRPRVEVVLDELPSTPRTRSMETKEPLTVEVVESRNAFDFQIVIRNRGDATLLRPLIILSAEPDRVRFEPTQYSGAQNLDILPFSQVRKGYSFKSRAVIPADVSAFEMIVDVSGDNMESHAATVRVAVVRKAK